MQKKRYMYHVMAATTTVVWGTTMVSSKVLLAEGMTPAQILLFRFLLGYALLWIMYPRTHRIRSWRDELIFVGMGLSGGSLYFLAENTALIYTQATNVSLICASAPLITAFFSCLFLHKKLPRPFWVGSAVAMTGVSLVILNGNFILKLNPSGDLLAFVAICCWSVYCLLLKRLRHHYHSLYITRNLFFYGLLTLMPYFFLHEPLDISLEVLQLPTVWSNLLFLGVVASAFCYVMWNMAMKEIGVVTTNCYLYFSPPVTLVTAAVVLPERITVFILFGAGLILTGLWIAGRRT